MSKKNDRYSWRSDHEDSNSEPPEWFQEWMDSEVYPIHAICSKCKVRIVDWKNDQCDCKSDSDYDKIWICSICESNIDNDIRSDYWHLSDKHPESMIMGRLSQ